MRLKKTFYIFLISIILLNISLIYATNVNESNVANYFRIHVVANSDSIDDQLIKYTISKRVNEYVANITKDAATKEKSKEIIEQNIQNILLICDNVLKEHNLNYDVKACIGKIEYSAKYKDNIKMAAGTYDSLKIVIGKGNGQNWWSLIYPTSFFDTSTEEPLNEEVTFSLGLVELLKNLFS